MLPGTRLQTLRSNALNIKCLEEDNYGNNYGIFVAFLLYIHKNFLIQHFFSFSPLVCLIVHQCPPEQFVFTGWEIVITVSVAHFSDFRDFRDYSFLT